MISSVTYGQTILRCNSDLVKSFSSLKFTANQSDDAEMALIMFLARLLVQGGVISIALGQTCMGPELSF